VRLDIEPVDQGCIFCSLVEYFLLFGNRAGGAVALVGKDDLEGAMTESIDGGCGQDAIGEGIGPFRDAQVGGDDGALALIAFGDHVMEIFILRSPQGFEAEVVDDEEIDQKYL